MTGKAIIFSAPSGSGKTTIVKHLLKSFPEKLAFSISATTRKSRKDIEVDGQDYHFLSQDDFQDKVRNDQLIEWEEVYPGTCYGTLKSEIDKIWAMGKVVVFDVDVKGGLNLKKYFGARALAVFVKVPDLETLKERLEKRKTETDSDLQKRLAKASSEMTFENQFDQVIVNKELGESLQKAENLFNSFLVN